MRQRSSWVHSTARWSGWLAVCVAAVGLSVQIAVTVAVARAFYGVSVLEGMRVHRQTEWSGLWGTVYITAAIVLGILSIAVGTGLPAARWSRRMGVAAIILAMFAWLNQGPMRRVQESMVKAECLSNVKDLVTALHMYADENGGVFPPASDWMSALGPCLREPDALACGWDPDFEGSYAYNAALSGAMYGWMADPATTIAIFETDAPGRAPSVGAALPESPRHLGGDSYGFADGSARWLPRERQGRDKAGEIIWGLKPVDDVTWELE